MLVAAMFNVEPKCTAPVVYCVPAVVKPKDDEEVAMLTLPDKKLCPEIINLVIEVVARVVVPLAVKSNTPEMSPPRITPLANVVVANLPLMVMLSVEAFPNMTSPLRVVVVLTVKSPVMVPSTSTVSPCIVEVEPTVKVEPK